MQLTNRGNEMLTPLVWQQGGHGDVEVIPTKSADAFPETSIPAVNSLQIDKDKTYERPATIGAYRA